jgi:membrane protease subunit (stomatin/prohibitin family)
VILIVCSLLAIGAIGFTLFVRERDVPPAPFENAELKHLETRRQVLYDNLKDLQFEYHQGKLSDEDYQSLKSGFLYDLAGILDAMERAQAAKHPGKPNARQAEKPASSSAVAVTAKSAAPAVAVPATERKCSSCGTSNAAGNRFCGQCGAELGK